MAHQRQHLIVSNSSSQRMTTSFQFWETTSCISTVWVWSFHGTVHASKMLSALKSCWSQWELKCTLLLSDQSLAKGRPKLMVRVIIKTQTWIISMKARGAAKTQFQTHNVSIFLHVQSASSLIQGCPQALAQQNNWGKCLNSGVWIVTLKSHWNVYYRCPLLLGFILSSVLS